MKSARWLPALMVLATIAGCTRWNFLNKGPEPKPPPVAGEAPPVSAYLDYLNDNARRIDTVRCTEIDVTCSQGFQSFGLRGKMVAQKPHNFSMTSDFIGKSAVEVGSNDKEFWYWISKADPPYQVYCSYKDLYDGRVKQLPFPFQPEWIMETMGMGTYGPADRYRLEADGSTIKLVEQSSSQGKATRKIIVMNRRAVQAPAPQVTAFLLVDDATGKEVCSAHITETQLDKNTGAIIPRRLEFRWPEQRFKMAMKLDGTAVNAQVPATAFVRRPMPGVPAFDLATRRLDQASADVQRVQSLR
jgi:hypothetical protein